MHHEQTPQTPLILPRRALKLNMAVNEWPKLTSEPVVSRQVRNLLSDSVLLNSLTREREAKHYDKMDSGAASRSFLNVSR